MWLTHRTRVGLLCFTLLFLLAPALIQPVYSVPSLSIDGSGSNICGGISCSVLGFGTSNPNDVMIAIAGTPTGPGVTFFTPTDSQGHLSFALRKTFIAGVTDSEWWAIASPTLSGDTIQVTTNFGSAFIALMVWGISGANSAAPFDPSAGAPATTAFLFLVLFRLA